MQGKFGPPPVAVCHAHLAQQQNGLWSVLVASRRIGEAAWTRFVLADLTLDDAREAWYTETQAQLPR